MYKNYGETAFYSMFSSATLTAANLPCKAHQFKRVGVEVALENIEHCRSAGNASMRKGKFCKAFAEITELNTYQLEEQT